MRPLCELDLECYPTYFLAKFYDERTGKFHSYGMWDGQLLDIPRIVDVLARVTIVTFNGVNYDVPMLALALYGATCAQLKEANDDIIVRQMKPWQFCEKWGIQIPDYIDHIDVMEVAPGVRIGLKMYMGRMHAPTLQDLPYDPDMRIDAGQRFVIADYCGNDLIGTNLLRHEVADRIALRVAIGQRYNIDVRSKSDAQIAEAVIKAQLDFKPSYRYIEDGYQFNYTPPDYIQYVTPQMRNFLDVVRKAPFVVRDKEEAVAMGYYDPDDPDAPKIRTGVRIPDALYNRDIIIGQTKYRLGIGGLHSQEKCVNYSTSETHILKDIDVKSYYPSLILTMGMVPDQLGPAFSNIYGTIYKRRLEAKSDAGTLRHLGFDIDAAEAQTESDGLKIVLNGTFGKLFSKWSVLYAPELGIRTTITGQLALLMLIEMMECSGIQVISANTDGIVLRVPVELDDIARQIVQWWEKRTGLEMEETLYRSVYSRDVNNYIAITTDGKAKRKGVFNQGGILSGPQGKGPNMDICADAVVAYLKDGTPIENTIRECQDIRKFIVLRGVKGGGYYLPMGTITLPEEREYLGKAVRWYYSLSARQAYIAYNNGNKVATSQGCRPCMKLPDALPADIDYLHYVNTAVEMLADVGIPVCYWHHAETDCYIVTIDDDWVGSELCDQITATQYKKRKL